MKKIILIISFFVPFFVQSMEINWTILENPTGKTVCGTKLGTLSHLVILNVTEGMPTGETFWSKAIANGPAKFNVKLYINENKSLVVGKRIDPLPVGLEKFMITVIDNTGNYFGSNIIKRPDKGWGDSVGWSPAWYLQSDDTKTPFIDMWGIPAPTTGPDGWVFSGHTTPVPEPSVLIGIVLGAVALMCKRKA